MMQWFKKHRQLLVDESTALSSDSNYKELHQYRNNLFISHGNIIVRLNEVKRYPILVVYTDASPYRLPIVFPLNKVLSNDEVNKIASLPLIEALDYVKPLVHYYYNLRHQNSSGELCILERDDLDAANSFYGISTILQRVRDWYAAHTTNNFPLESEEVNFSAHFNFINREIQLIYPEHFFKDQFTEGDCYAILYNYQQAGLFFLHD